MFNYLPNLIINMKYDKFIYYLSEHYEGVYMYLTYPLSSMYYVQHNWENVSYISLWLDYYMLQ